MSHIHVHICTLLLHLIPNLTWESKKQSKLYLVFSLSISASHCWHVFVWLGYLSGVSQSGFCGFWGHLAWGFCIFGWDDVFCCSWFWCLPSQSSLSWFLQKGQFGPHPHFSVFGLMIDCSPILSSSFIEGFGLVMPVAFVLSLFK